MKVSTRMTDFGDREPTARELLLLIEGHNRMCTLLQRINMAVLSTILVTVLSFAGYTYSENQRMHDEEIKTMLAIRQVSPNTVNALKDQNNGQP